MADTTGGGAAAPDALSITVGGLTVAMRPCGWIDYVAIPRDFNALLSMPTDTRDERAAFADALLDFGARLDAYAAGPVRPSMVPPGSMMDFLRRWREGVRDATVDPPSADGLPRPSSTSTPPAAARSPRRRTSRAAPGAGA